MNEHRPATKDNVIAFLRTLQGKIITVLSIIALILGILSEGVSLLGNYYSMIKLKAEAVAASSTPADFRRNRVFDNPTGTDPERAKALKIYDEYYSCVAAKSRSECIRPTLPNPWTKK